MANFQRVKLGDVVEIISGGTPDSNNLNYWKNGNICWATLPDLHKKYFFDTQRKITNLGLKNSSAKLLPKNTVIFSSRATIGEISIAKIETSTNQGSKNFICNPGVLYFEYLYYYLKYKAKSIEESASGTTYKEINKTQFSNLEIILPDLSIQTRIASVLSAYDDLIENNEKRIKALEEMAQLLYIEWFVKYSPPVEGWQALPDGVVSSRGTQHYMSIPYNPKLKDRARELRKAGNLSEVLFWQQVKNGKFNGLDFDRQKIIGNYIVDFYCANMGLVVEIDGSSHDDKLEYDEERNNYLSSLGLTVIHIPDIEIKKNLEGVMEGVRKRIGKPPRHCCGTPPREGNESPLHGRGMKMIDSGTEYGMVPEGWEVKKLGDLIQPQYGFTTSAVDKISGIQFLRGMDINKTSYIDWSSVPYCEIKAGDKNKYTIQKGDIFIIRMADPGKIGICEKQVDAVFASYLMRLKIKNRLTNYYLFYFLISEKYQNFIGGSSSGTTRKSVNSKQVGTINILIPDQQTLKNFEEKTSLLRSKITNLLDQNQNLSKTRNLLIPQLVTGKRELK